MKKIILLLFMLNLSFYSKAQSTIFEDSFESYTNFAITNVGNWTLTDVDGGVAYGFNGALFLNSTALKSFQVFNPAFTTPPLTVSPVSNWTARTGVQHMVCFNKSTPAPLVNDDWMISPKITTGTGNSVKFWAKSCSAKTTAPSEFEEKFDVWISSTNTSIPSFVKISGATVITTIAPGATWREYTYSIPASYDNSSVHIGIHCVSEDQFGLGVDDFKVLGTVPCAPPLSGTSVVNPTAITATLSWTAGGALNSEVKVQLAGAGTPAITNDTGVNVSATTYTTSPLIVNTNYEFWVRDECTDGTLFSAWSGPFTFNTNEAPKCAVLVAPADAATAIPTTAPVTLSWTAATTGSIATSYDVYFGTAPVPVTLVENVTVLSSTRLVSALTTYYWKVVSKNAAGSATGCTSVFSFTTGPNAFSPYCGPVVYSNALEPITYVNFSGIDITYPNTIVPVATAVHHKIFTDVATLPQGSTKILSLKGNTGGAFTNKFIVFIDWNQNGVLNDAGEVYFDTAPLTIGAPIPPGITSVGSTGLPEVAPVTGNIAVPTTAKLGNTRMRIKKVFAIPTAIPGGFIDPCISLTAGATFGEMHDYVVKVTAPDPLAANTFSSVNFKSYPNPVKDILNLSYDRNITNIFVINLLGQEVLNAKLDSQEIKIDMTSLTSGAYFVRIVADNEAKTIKVIKE